LSSGWTGRVGGIKNAHNKIQGRDTVAIFFTGGTIAMKLGRGSKGVVPEVQFQSLVDQLEPFQKDVHLKAIHWADLPSPHMTPERMFQLARDVEKVLQEPHINGAVIVHGTDVMEETAFMMDLVIDSPKPVVLTGAMRYHNEPGYDGLRNLLYSVRACQAPESLNMGAMVLMTDRLYAAREVTKVHSINVDAFESPGLGPLGFVEGDELHFVRSRTDRAHFRVENIEPNVDLVKLCTGMDDRFIRCSLEHGVAGLVIEALGSGNVPPGVVRAIEETVEQGIPVVLTTRCIRGGAWPIYGYPGGGKSLHKKGVIMAGRLSGQKARIQLMVALAKTRDLQQIRELFEST
jgi:L-asparaginase